jgi:TP901 family phage tail tape measure protein
VTLTQFHLAGDKASHVADLLAAGASKALGSVDDLGQGLKYVGPVAHSMGVSLEETVGTLALFAQNGILGEQAGTGLRGVLSSLTSPSAAASKEIQRLGITLYDSQGKFLGLANMAGELSKAYGTMDGASRDASLGVIFGNQQVTAARVLFEAGAVGVTKWTAAVNDSGYAALTAAIRMDNLSGRPRAAPRVPRDGVHSDGRCG